MRCRSAEERIQALLDDRLDPLLDAELVEHATECSRCNDLLRGQGVLLEGLAELATPSLPSDFSRRVVGTVTLQQSSSQRYAPVRAILAVVAMLLLLLTLWPSFRSGHTQGGRAPAVASAAAGPAHSRGAVGRSMAFDSREVQIAIEYIVVQWANSEGARFQVDQIAGTIRPLASTLNVAFDAIRRSIPVRRQSTPGDPQARETRGLWGAVRVA